MRVFLLLAVIGSLSLFVPVQTAAAKEKVSFEQAEKPASNPDKAILYVYRTYAPPIMWSVGVVVDKQKRADLRGHSFTWFYVEPGEHDFKFKWPNLISGATVEFKKSFEAGRVYSLEYTGAMEMGYRTTTFTSIVDEVDPDAAAARMQACCSYRPSLDDADK